ncbi:hypothetical protein IFJ82_04405 [Novacetimonas hansenii]|uniref:hypothetical protein n=1 Tax=Novacetimonas hansenii TaxID=436 RepID=UPI001782E09C|nr:hypothetical protein [Novacetimonas hansenii]MBL7237606.1 hypothetical protein [Novacetimonas hansenii]QOF95876.1 hypothetical protein IFJ82_04405 [Novacetimonas hansenii]
MPEDIAGNIAQSSGSRGEACFAKHHAYWEKPASILKRLLGSKSLIENKKSFWVPPFFKKAASSEAFWKKLHQKPL